MSKLPEQIQKAWADRDGPVILTTISQDGIPNAIYASAVSMFEGEYLIVSDNYFDKTRRNILSGSSGSILFRDNAGKAYQAKGQLEYYRDGPIYDDMKAWNSKKLPGIAALALVVKEVYSGAERIL